jgi:hypothetical protein
VGKIFSTLLLFGLVLIAQALTQRLGWGGAVVTYGLLVGTMTGSAGLLLRSAATESITWRNRLAGWLLPWTAWVGSGTLSGLLIKNSCLSLVFGWGTIMLTALGWNGALDPVMAAPGSGHSMGWHYFVAGLTFICWLTLGVGWWQLCQNLIGQRLGQPWRESSQRRSGWLILGTPLLLIASVTLRQFDLAGWALTIVLVPLLAILFPVITLSAVLLYHWAIGKPIRWN